MSLHHGVGRRERVPHRKESIQVPIDGSTPTVSYLPTGGTTFRIPQFLLLKSLSMEADGVAGNSIIK